MENTNTKVGLVFSLPCPHFEKTVILKKEIWLYKILTSHAEINHSHLDFIKQVLTNSDDTISKYRKLRNHNKVAIFKECPHFLPYDRYLKIAVDLSNGKEAVITTIQAVYNLPDSEMEEII